MAEERFLRGFRAFDAAVAPDPRSPIGSSRSCPTSSASAGRVRRPGCR